MDLTYNAFRKLISIPEAKEIIMNDMNDTDFINGIRLLQFSDKRFAYLKRNGDLLIDMSFSSAEPYFTERGWVFVTDNGSTNLLSSDGKLLYEKWFNCHISEIKLESTVIYGVTDPDTHMHNYINQEGKLILDTWVERTNEHLPKLWPYVPDEVFMTVIIVKIGRRFNYIKDDGTLVIDGPADKWFNVDDYFGGNVMINETDKFFSDEMRRIILNSR